MTLQQLRYVIMTADCGSMNEAAKRLFISQPSLSGTIKELEEEIGLDIFLRSNRGIVITPEGEEFLGYARQVAEQYRLLTDKYLDKDCLLYTSTWTAMGLCIPGRTYSVYICTESMEVRA